MESTSNIWFDETKKRVAGQRANVKLLQNAEPLENDKLTKMDSSLKKLTAFMKKTKSIGASNPAAQLLPELDKLNLLKFLDEIASNICDLKLKGSEIPDLVNFVIQLSCRYQQFPELLLNELKKILPYKKSDKIENPGKLKFDLKFLGELVLNGIFAKPGVDLLGNCLAFLVQTDTSEFTHVPLLLPLCRPTLFDFVGFVPFSEKLKKFDHDELEELTTMAFTENNRRAVRTLLKNYYDSLIKQLNNIRIKMNKMHKSIKKQERTKGDASQFDRQEFESLKQGFEKLKQMAQDFGEVIGEQVPQMDEDPSDDEIDEGLARQIDNDLAEGKTSLWPDKDTMNFYECLMDTTRLSPMKLEVNIEDADDDKIEPETAEEKTVAEFAFADSVDAVDLTELENSPDTTTVVEDYIEEEEPEETQDESNVTTEPSSLDQILDSMHQPQFLGVQITTFLENLSSAMNRDLIDRAASYFVAALSKKSNRKKLINHFLNSPRDRLDLLPFYGRFLATTNRVMPDIASTVTKELLLRFRVMASSKIEPPKKIKEAQRKTRKVDEGVFLSRFLAELTKFKLLPKAETLTCLRSLLVDLRSYKVDMAAVMIESVGIFLYRSSDSHAKMKVILEVVQRKMGVIKDPRHKILLENAYYSILPPEETSILHMRDPLKSYISTVVRSIAPTKRGKDPVKILLGIDWTDSSLVDYLCSQLSDVCAINYDYLADVADTVRGLSDSFSDLGVFVTDTVLESIRIALETNKMVHHQRLHCSVNYLNWLYVCGVCEFSVIMQVLYQLIRLGINLESYSLDQLIKRTKRVRVAADLVIEVIEYVDTGKSSVQLDNFIHYLLNFYYSTQSLWKDRSEDLGDFPFDVVDRIEKMLAHIAKICGKKRITRYAKDLDASKENIAKIEEKYKFDVQRSLAQGLKMATTEATLDSIQEEEEDASDDDEEVEDEEDDEMEDEHEVDTSEHDEPAKAHYVDTTDPEEIHVHVKRKFDENDAEFDRDFERMLAESIQMAAHQPRQPIIDLTVPPSVRQKFERKINFVGEKINDEPKNFQMALMTKSKGKPMLKPVQLHVSQSMKDSWNQQRMHSEKERQQVKEITLQMNERIQQRVDEEPLDPIPQTVPNRFQTDPSDCHIPAGPRQKH